MSKKRTTTNALALNNQFTANDVVAKLREELKKLKAVTECAYKTSGDIGIGGMTNIQQETKIDNLIKAYSSVNGRAKMYIEAATELGIEEFPQFTVGGGNLDAWKHDIQLRMDVIRYSDRKAELEGLLKEAEGFMTVDDKKSLFLAKLQASLSK